MNPEVKLQMTMLWARYIYFRDHGNHCSHVIAYYGYLMNNSQE